MHALEFHLLFEFQYENYHSVYNIGADINTYKSIVLTVDIRSVVSQSTPPSTLKPHGGPPTSTIGKGIVCDFLLKSLRVTSRHVT